MRDDSAQIVHLALVAAEARDACERAIAKGLERSTWVGQLLKLACDYAETNGAETPLLADLLGKLLLEHASKAPLSK